MEIIAQFESNKQTSSSKLYHVGFVKTKKRNSSKGKPLQKKPPSKSSDQISESIQKMADEVMPKKPNEIFEIRMQKVMSDKNQLFIVLEILEQS